MQEEQGQTQKKAHPRNGKKTATKDEGCRMVVLSKRGETAFVVFRLSVWEILLSTGEWHEVCNFAPAAMDTNGIPKSLPCSMLVLETATWDTIDHVSAVRYLVLGFSDGCIHLIKVPSKQQPASGSTTAQHVHTWHAHHARVSSLMYLRTTEVNTSDVVHHFMSSSAGGQATWWSLHSARFVEATGDTGSTQMQTSSGESLLPPGLSRFAHFQIPSKSPVTCCCIDAEHKALFCGDGRGTVFAFLIPGTATCLHAASAVVAPTTSLRKAHGISAVACMQFKNGFLFSGGHDGNVCQYKVQIEAASIGLVRSLEFSARPISSVLMLWWDQMGQLCVGGFQAGLFMTWNLDRRYQYWSVECGGWRRPYDVVVNKASPQLGLTVVYAPLPPTNENVNTTTTHPSSILSCVQAFSTLLPLPGRFVEDKGIAARQESAPLSNMLLLPYKQCSLLSDFHARPTSSVLFCACIPHTVSKLITSKQPYNPFSVIFATGGETTHIKLMVSQTLSTIQDSSGQTEDHWPCLPLPHCVSTLSGHESSVRALAVSSSGKMGGVKDMSEDASLSSSPESISLSPILFVSAGGKQIVRCWRLHTHHHQGPENSGGGGGPYCTAEAVSSFKWAEHEVFKKKLTHTKHKKRLWQADKMKEDADQRINGLACFPLLQTHAVERNSNVDSVEATEHMDESRSEDGTRTPQSLTLKSYHMIVAGTTDGTLLFLLLEENSGHTSLLCCLKPDGARRPILSLKHLCIPPGGGGEDSIRSLKDVLFAGSTDGTILIFDISDLLRFTRGLLQACPDNDSSMLKDDQLGDIEHWAAMTEPLQKLDSNQMGVNSLDIAPVAFHSHGISGDPPCYVLACGGDDQALCVFWLSFEDPTSPTGFSHCFSPVSIAETNLPFTSTFDAPKPIRFTVVSVTFACTVT